jgi:hypothetical protein
MRYSYDNKTKFGEDTVLKQGNRIVFLGVSGYSFVGKIKPENSSVARKVIPHLLWNQSINCRIKDSPPSVPTLCQIHTILILSLNTLSAILIFSTIYT